MPKNFNITELNVYADGTNFINKAQVYVLYKNDLRESSWKTNPTPYTLTGEVTRISVTNDAPQCFYKVTDGK